MPIDLFQTLDVIEAMENFIVRKRPPENIRHLVDLDYKIDGQSIIIFEIRPTFKNPDIKMESNIAKATFVKSKSYWKIFWKRADLKWHSYEPAAVVNTIGEFLNVVEEDRWGCFWG